MTSYHTTMTPTMNTVSMTANKTRQRKSKATLPPTLAHEMDVLRAARQGIDISGMAPDERCKYAGKFCCHKRVRKSTGKLHRFCEYHRARANVNQKRWTEIRRKNDFAQIQVEDSASSLVVSDAWQTGASMVRLAPAASVVWPVSALESLSICIPAPLKHDELLFDQQPTSPTNVDAFHDGDIPMSEDDIDSLMTIVAENEKSMMSENEEDAWLMAMLNDFEEPAVAFSVFDGLAL